MKKMKFLTLCLLMVLSSTLFAQSVTIPNVLNFKSKKQSGSILEDNKIVGYYIFYFKEKTDKENSAYEVELFDDNFKSLKKIEITRPKRTVLFEMVYNGAAFMFFFYDSKTGYEYITYDRQGTKLGSLIIPEDDIPNYDLAYAKSNLSSGTENSTFYPMGKNGFLRQSYTKNKKMGYELIAYDNNVKKLWSYASDETSKMLESVEISEINNEIVTATIYRRKSAMTRQMDLAFLILDSESGDKIAEVAMGTEDSGKKSVLKAFAEKESSKITLIGEYYKAGDDILKDKSQGIFLQELDFSGSTLSTKEYAWKGSIDVFKQENMDEEDKKEAGKSFSIFFHDAVRSKNGHLYLIGEQFRKQVSAGAIAGKLAVAALGGSSDASNFEIRVGNMIVMEFDETNKLVHFDIVNKKKTSVLLPQGMGVYGSAYLGYYINSIGGFDYAFTSRDKANDKFSIVYVDANKKEDDKSKKSDVMLGVITFDEGVKKLSRLPINTEAKFYWIQPAKPGYITVAEYFRKEKSLILHLEQLAY